MQRVLGAQEYTSRLKNKIVAKEVAPQPLTRRYNYIPISRAANRATIGECCGGTLTNGLLVDLSGIGEELGICVCNTPEIGCPGPYTLPPLPGPTQTLTLQFTNAIVPDLPVIALFSFTGGNYDFRGTIVTVNGTPVVPSFNGPGSIVLDGPFPPNSTVTYSFPTPLTVLDAVCFVPLGG